MSGQGAVDVKRASVRKISKYDLDRAEIDFEGLRREKEKERAGNAKGKKDDMDKEIEA